MRVGSERRAVALDHAGETRRAHLLLGIEQHLDVDRRRLLLRAEQVDRGQQHHDRRLVVGRRAREHAQLGIERARLQLLASDLLPFALRVAPLDDGSERIRLRPVLGNDRLAVEMRIQQHCARLRAGTRELGQHGRAARGIVEPTHLEAALRERLLEESRVALDVRRLVCDVRESRAGRGTPANSAGPDVRRPRSASRRARCWRERDEHDDRHERRRAHGLLRGGIARES